MDKILLAIESCCNNLKNRVEVIENIWISKLNKAFDVKIFIGNSTECTSTILDNDVITLDCDDTYYMLTEKTYCILKWYLDNCDYPFIIVSDDDIYIHTEKFNQYTLFKEYDYVGRFAFGGMEKLPDREMSGFASGCFYILSRYAAQYIVDNFKKDMIEYYKSAEDACIGDILRKNIRIKKYDEESIMPWSGCRYFDNLMVGHYAHLNHDPPITFYESMKKMHSLYHNIEDTQ